ncbi:hypothetical protein CI109_104019 [Kwoniella shandongensis]|uniref:Uncharacterized protein n=1 Tax=Kwoniella shandongensis TaxID=1734106 RepID=A0AAJ8LHX2_9TREE
MRKDIGPFTIDTKPPYKPWDGNQATILFFPVIGAFVLTLISTLSSPIIHGLSVVEVKMGGGLAGSVKLGAWGWCANGVTNVTDQCSSLRPFGDSMSIQLGQLPSPVLSLVEISEAIPKSFWIGNGVMHLLACITLWSTLLWTLAVSGKWDKKELEAYDWTRYAFYQAAGSGVFICIAWILDLNMITRIKNKSINVDGVKVSVKPAVTIWLMMIAFMFCFVSCLTRIVWGRYRSRPLWTIKGQGNDFLPTPTRTPPFAVPTDEDLPPSWESLNINEKDIKQVVVQTGTDKSRREDVQGRVGAETLPLGKHDQLHSPPSIDKPGFAV